MWVFPVAPGPLDSLAETCKTLSEIRFAGSEPTSLCFVALGIHTCEESSRAAFYFYASRSHCESQGAPPFYVAAAVPLRLLGCRPADAYGNALLHSGLYSLRGRRGRF